jgi:uncharacterized membrane-anchored protein YhcB (DUF1043 family)
MSTHTRNNFKWGVQEILSLQREFQLLNLSIDEIAKKHKRTPRAIMLKLDKEGMADYNSLYTHYYESTRLIPDGEIKMEIVSQDGSEYDNEEEEEEEQEEEQDDGDSEYIDEENGSEYYGDDEEYEDEDEDPLTKRVAKLETDIKEILQTLKDLSSKIKS